MKYKALMLDVDGTTVQIGKKLPSHKVIETVKLAQEKLHVGLVTGRPYFLAKRIIDSLSLSGISILSGGAQVINVEDNTLLWEMTIDLEIIKQIQQLVPTHQILLTDGNIDVPFSPTISLTKTLDAAIQALTLVEADHIITTITHIPTIVTHTVASHTPGKVDVLISHVSATKQHGIFEFAKILGIETHEIIGIGDGGNDLPLLMACGLKVAMGNANDDLKAIADYIAPTVEEDGVAQVIEKFILNNN